MDVDVIHLADATPEQLAACALELDHALVKPWITESTAVESLRERVRRDQHGEAVHLLVLLDHAPVGWAGWVPFDSGSPLVETTTFLSPRIWGTGVNVTIKALQWQVCQLAGVQLVIVADESNLRSRAALTKLWPAAPHQRIYEHDHQRSVMVYRIEEPPLGFVPWDPALAGGLAQLVRPLVS